MRAGVGVGRIAVVLGFGVGCRRLGSEGDSDVRFHCAWKSRLGVIL